MKTLSAKKVMKLIEKASNSEGLVNVGEFRKIAVDAEIIGKRAKEWGMFARSKNGKAHIKRLNAKSDTSIYVSLKGNTSKFKQGTYVHPELAQIYAAWISPEFEAIVHKAFKKMYDAAEAGTGLSNQQMIDIITHENAILEVERNVREEFALDCQSRMEERIESALGLNNSTKQNSTMSKLLNKYERESERVEALIQQGKYKRACRKANAYTEKLCFAIDQLCAGRRQQVKVKNMTIDDLGEQVRGLEDKVEGLQQEIGTMHQQVDNMHQQITGMGEQINKLTSIVVKLADKL
ncbi:hypothetical protein GR11A_00099 [Vibrio phage vB_VcorM_GR11A]|nr:hypothetical protein GR11A_00099 [Vibrio phage vB_VcorM_GR11A]